jgi:hypothetical protein
MAVRMLDITKFQAHKMNLNPDRTTIKRKVIFFLKGLRLQYYFVIQQEGGSQCCKLVCY